MLAAGALVASILAVGASPAAAAQTEADAQATWTACVGPAMADQGFDDVSMTDTGSHYANINCLIYYGITSGKTADTYDPGGHVTRSQMALFLVQMANLAGVDLGDVMDAGFTDLGSTGENRVAAINRLAAKGIMSGRTPATFDPTGYVTRGDMAQHLFAFADLALDSVHIDNLPITVDGDGTGIELNVVDGDGHPVDDWFGDARRTQPAHVDEIIGAVYELGITAGTNGLVGSEGTFSPDAPVTRGQMATFIMNTLNHTNLRPAGVTAQQTRTQTQVSVRTADFEPVADANVELFTTNYANDVFNDRGECISRYVSDAGYGFETGWETCRIDSGEQQTDKSGNHVFTQIGSAGRPTQICGYTLKASGLDDPDSKYGIWAWTGDYGDIVDSDTDLVVPGSANAQTGLRTPASALFSGGTKYDLKMGTDTLSYTIQLLDRNGDPVGPEPDVNRTFSVTTYVINVDRTSPDTVDLTGETLSPTARKATETRTPDRNGRISIRIPHPDPDGPASDYSDVLVVVTVELGGAAQAGLDITDAAQPNANVVAGNVPGDDSVTVEVGGSAPTVAMGASVFSDDAREASSYTVSTRSWGRYSSTGNVNEATFTLLDQYGDRHSGPSGTTYQFQLTPTITPVSGPVTGTVVANGRARIVYTSGPAAVQRKEAFGTDTNIEVQSSVGGAAFAVVAPAIPIDGSATVYWAEPGSGANNGATAAPLYVADPAARSLVVGQGSPPEHDPVYYVFGTDDRFTVGTTAVSFAQFVEVLQQANNPANTDIAIGDTTTLAWTGYNSSQPRDRAHWTLSNICTGP